MRGRVEVCIDSTWYTICDSHWNKNEASVVCQQLGYSPFGKNKYLLKYFSSFKGALAATKLFVDNEWPTGLESLYCYGNESLIWQCQYTIATTDSNCLQEQDASVFCLRK